MSGYLLGIDIGTSGAKGLIVNLEGDVIGQSLLTYSSQKYACFFQVNDFL
jgi:sugar (pentulose or hexulose) kinase